MIASNLTDVPDDVRAKLAEMFDLHATIRPDGSENGYHVDLTANIPLEQMAISPEPMIWCLDHRDIH